MRLVIVESPFAGRHGHKCVCPQCVMDVAQNRAYARLAMRDCLLRGEAPFASHLLYTQDGILDDTDVTERALGMAAGFEWGRAAHATVVYTDRGVSGGMKEGIERARLDGRPVEYRELDVIEARLDSGFVVPKSALAPESSYTVMRAALETQVGDKAIRTTLLDDLSRGVHTPFSKAAALASAPALDGPVTPEPEDDPMLCEHGVETRWDKCLPCLEKLEDEVEQEEKARYNALANKHHHTQECNARRAWGDGECECGGLSRLRDITPEDLPHMECTHGRTLAEPCSECAQTRSIA